MSETDTRLCLALHSIPDFPASQLRKLLLQCGGPDAVFSAGRQAWRHAGLPAQACDAIELAFECGGHPASEWTVERSHDAMASVAAGVLAITDSRYPVLLRTIPDPPPLLYYRGDPGVFHLPGIAMVGSRKASPAGLRLAGELASAAAGAGLAVTSGLALGIDGAAHQGALAGGGATVAVMATGVEQVYPRRHRALAAQIAELGCLLTEFPPGVPPLRGNFPRRNRLISGLSLATVVIEAALPSGSLLTAGTALEQGRDVFAAPWSIFHPNGRGCLRLIRDGAGVLESIEAIISELDALYQLQLELQVSPPTNASQEPLPSSHATLLSLIGDHAVDLDTLVADCGMPVAVVLAGLSALELRGSIARVPGGYALTGGD